jgi:hypothetical protein
MTVFKQIEFARQMLPNAGAYARVMSGAIRAAGSPQTAAKFRAAVMVDNMAHAFDGWATSCPVAKRES